MRFGQVCFLLYYDKSSSAAVLAASSDRLGPHRSVRVDDNDDLLELKLAQAHVALTGLTRQQVLQLMMTYSCIMLIRKFT